MTTTAGAISVQVEANTAGFESSMDRAAASAERSYQRQQKAQAAAQRDNDKFVSSIQRQVDSFGLSGAALQRYEASLRGVSAQADPLIERLERMKDAAAAFSNTKIDPKTGNAVEDIGKKSDGASHGLAGITRELLVLGHEASQGNYKRLGGSLLVLGELLTGSVASMGLLAAGVVLLGVPVIAFGAALAVGSAESRKLRNDLQLTGNAAGVTAGQIDIMSRQIATSTGRGVGAARTAIEELVKTGEVGPRLIAPMATAVVQLEHLTGESADSIVKDFGRMGDGVAKWAAEHNKQLNFISGDQYAYIKRLEEQGQKETAELEVLRLLNDHLKDLHPNLGLLESAWKSMGEQAGIAWDAMKGLGRAETVEGRLDAIAARLANPVWTRFKDALTGGLAGGVQGAAGSLFAPVQSDAQLRDAQGAAQSDLILQRRVAAMDAATAASHRMQVAAIDARDKWREETKGLDLVNKELEKYRLLTVAPLKGTENEISPAEQAATEAAIRKKYDPAGNRAGVKLENAYKAELEALTAEGIKLDAEIKSWELYGKGVDKARLAVLNLKIEQGKLQGLSPAEAARLRAKAAEDDEKDKQLAQIETRVKATQAADKFVQKLTEEANAHATNAREQDLANRIAELDRIGVQKGTAAYGLYVDAIEKAVTAKHDQVLANKLAAQQLGVDEEVAKLNEQVDALRMTTLERQNATIALRIQKQAEKDILADPSGEIAIRDAAIRQTDQLTSANTRLYNAQRTAGAGADQFFRKYQEDASDAAKVTETLAGQATKTLEDSITSLLSGQKTNFHSMVDALIQEIFRLTIVKPLLADIFGGITGGAGGGSLGLSGGSAGGLLGALGGLFGFGGGGSGGATAGASSADLAGIFGVYAQGTPYVPQDGPAWLHKGEAVIPAAYNSSGGRGGGGSTYHVHVNATPGMSRETAMQQGRDIMAGLRSSESRNG